MSLTFEQSTQPSSQCEQASDTQRSVQLSNDHIQIQMIYQSAFSDDGGIRRHIASMSELIEHNNKAILGLIEVKERSKSEERTVGN